MIRGMAKRAGSIASMSEIQVGDLVQVVRWPHEHGAEQLGTIWCVQGFAAESQCATCRESLFRFMRNWKYGQSAVLVPERHFGVPVSWPKKIPPLAALRYA